MTINDYRYRLTQISRAVAIFAALGFMLAGCANGTKAEFAAMPDTGPLTPTRLAMAKAECGMKVDDKIDRQFQPGGIPDANGVLRYAEACYASQGIVITGYRRKDGRLTASPWGS